MVEWKKLGEIEDAGVLTLGRGQVISKKDMRDCPGEYPVYSSSSQGDGEIGRYGRYMFDDERITWSIDGGGKLFYRNHLKYSVTNVCGWLRVNKAEIINTRFLYYLLFNQWSNIEFNYNHKAHPSIIRNEYLIPIIPLSEQTRIVGILDTFTASIDNLKEQIAERRKQYEYYRDQLLDLEGKEGAEMKTLGEVCLKTKNIKWKSEPEENSYFYIDLSSVNIDLNNITDTTEINKDSAPSRAQQIVKIDDILLGTTRPTLKRYCQVPMQYDNQICSTGYCVFRANTAIVLSRWIFHNIGNGRFWDYCEQKQQGAGYPCLSNSDAFAYIIPVPSLSEQQRIVSILDTFEASIQNLEAQLKQRQKQYEYYRNKLLTFD